MVDTFQSKKLGIFTIVLLIVGAVDSVRNLPATALFGPALIFFFIFAAIIFLIPCALVSAQLAANSDTQSGIFHWTRNTLGESLGFLAIWLQWISNLVWFPTILSFIASSAAWLFLPDLAQNKYWIVSLTLGVFWFLTFLNLKGIRISARFASFCTVIGLIIPITLILILTILWMMSGNPIQIQFNTHTVFPHLNDPQNWISLTAIMTAFVGIELVAVHAKDVINPRKTFPIALFFSVIIILVTMIAGSLAIAMILPNEKISLVNGVLQTFDHFFTHWHGIWLTPLIALCIILGTSGGISSWIMSLARGLGQAGEFGFLPQFLLKKNTQGVASTLLITQAILVSLFCMAFFLLPSINGSYWFLTALSTQTYTLMYILLFIAGIFSYTQPRLTEKLILNKKTILWSVCGMGLLGCLLTEIIGFIPPATIPVGNTMHYEIFFCSGILLVLLPPILLCWYRYKKLKYLVPAT